jgi:hypothetical protein
LPLDSQGNLIFNTAHQEYLETHNWKKGCRLQYISNIPECQHLIPEGHPRVTPQASKDRQLSQRAPLPQTSEDQTVVPKKAASDIPPPQGENLTQKKATSASRLFVPKVTESPGPHLGKKLEPGHQVISGKSSEPKATFRPGPQSYQYPEDSAIHQALIAAEGQLSKASPYKSGRYYPLGLEPKDIAQAFSNQGNSKLLEVHQLYSDGTVQITRASNSGYTLTSQRLAIPESDSSSESVL